MTFDGSTVALLVAAGGILLLLVLGSGSIIRFPTVRFTGGPVARVTRTTRR